MLLQGFLFRHPNITPAGWPTQPGMGYGALLAAIGFLMLFCQGLAARGFCRGDAFVVSAIGLVVATHRGVRVLPDLRHARERVRRQLRRQLLRPLDLGPGLPVLRPALRRGLEHRAAGDRGRRRLDAARARVRADLGAHRVPLQGRAARDERAADHHAALRHRPCHHPAVRPRRCDQQRCSTTGSTFRARAGSTASPAWRSRSCSPSRRSPSSCCSAWCRASARRSRKPRRRCARAAGPRSAR